MKRYLLGSRLQLGRVRLPWSFVLIAAWLTLWIVPDLERLYEKHLLQRPWITATVEIIPRDDRPPRVRYQTSTVTFLPGTIWRTRIETKEVYRTCGGEGVWDYKEGTGPEIFMSSEDFHGKVCEIPAEPYRYCVSYVPRTASGVQSDTDWYCSEFHNPTEENQ